MWIAIGVTIAVVGTICLAVLINHIIKENVKKYSKYYQAVIKLNEETAFLTIWSQIMDKTVYLNSKKAFDNFNASKYAQEYVNANKTAISELIEKVNKNRATQKRYNEKFEKIEHTMDPKIAKKARIGVVSFVKKETELANSIRKTGCTELSLTIKYQYTSPAGRNHYEAKRTYSYNDILRMLNTVSVTVRIKKGSSTSKISRSERDLENALMNCFGNTKPINRPLTIDDIEDIDE